MHLLGGTTYGNLILKAKSMNSKLQEAVKYSYGASLKRFLNTRAILFMQMALEKWMILIAPKS